jgi:hypothetical protein
MSNEMNRTIEVQGKITITISAGELLSFLKPNVLAAVSNQPLAKPGQKRIRTITECLNMLKVDDPDSAITYNFIKTLANEDRVKHFKAGKKYMINYDDLLEVLAVS